MLLEKARQLTEAARKSIEYRKYLEHRQGFETRYQAIDRERKELNELVESLRLFRQRALITSDFQPKVKSALEMIDRAVEQVPNDPSWILDNQNFNAQQLKKSLDDLKTEIRKQLSREWKKYIDRQISNINSDTFDLFRNIDALKPQIQEISRLYDQIEREKNQLPRYDRQFENTDDLIRQITRAWNDLGADHVPEAVQAFLKSATSNAGASFKLYTPEVQDWLTEQGLTKHLRIRLN